MSTPRRSTRNRRSPSRYGFSCERKPLDDGLNSIIKAIEILENVVIKIEDPIDKHIDHYNNQGISVKKTGKNSLEFIDEEDSNYLNDNEFKLALINAQNDHNKWIKIVEKGIQQWKKNYIDLTY